MEGNDDGEQRELENLPAVVRPRQMRSSLQERQRRSRDAQKLLQDPQKGQAQHLRSRNNAEKSYVKFCNGTSRNVVLYWIDYEGQAVSFGTLPSGVCVDIDTFVTHPWIFVDEETGDRLMVEQKDVYFPRPPTHYFLDGLPRPGRSLVSIMTPIFTLQEMAARAIIGCLRDEDQVDKLEIPAVLKAELRFNMRFAMWENYFKNHFPSEICCRPGNNDDTERAEQTLRELLGNKRIQTTYACQTTVLSNRDGQEHDRLHLNPNILMAAAYNSGLPGQRIEDALQVREKRS